MRLTFDLTGDHIALCDLLKVCDIMDTGGAAKQFIADGNVEVDGELELRKTRKIRPGMVVTGDDFEIHVVAAPA
ncbi:RNA-binding S4 domain-containing protein [Bailinhaonella thermotolerans]|uniref:RNA-binding S4 domain-containing protein n=1 Tax=Bailinhaonella thermotolerans TaxID=1070861 RepID=A0A3A4AS08_9ACTN|nr:RNA-binding S4 domain-containing protein [Bailinhaonella thermotolerans]RJL31971.1 RNA-binding S4 domain-containing protein [Bailinhaonella thermotolerans]